MNASGLQAIAIGIGEPRHAQRYCSRLAPSLTCFVDPTLRSYAEYGLTQATLGQLLNPKMFIASMNAFANGHLQGPATGDARMLGGTFVIDTQGVIQRAYYSSYPGDNPDLDGLLNGCV